MGRTPGPFASLARLFRDGNPRTLSDGQFIAAVDAADRARLAPALWAHGCREGWWHPVPSDAARLISGRADLPFGQPELALQAAGEANAERNRDLLAQGATIEAAFADSGITSVRLKGWHTLTSGWWTDEGERTMTDLDVLVPDGRLAEACTVLTDLGYEPIESGHTDEADHELAPVHLPGRTGSVEIHRALAVSRWSAVLPADEVLAGSRPMSTTDAVTHLILHAQLHDEAHLLGTVPWRALRELAVLTTGSRGGEVDWELVGQRFDASGAGAALDGFLWLARTLLGAVVPPLGRRVRLRARTARLLMDRPVLRDVSSRAAYMPRALSASRMRTIDPTAPAWATRIRRVLSRAKRH